MQTSRVFAFLEISLPFNDFPHKKKPNFFPYLNAHAEWEWQGGHDEEDGDEGEEESAAAGALGVSWEGEIRERESMF